MGLDDKDLGGPIVEYSTGSPPRRSETPPDAAGGRGGTVRRDSLEVDVSIKRRTPPTMPDVNDGGWGGRFDDARRRDGGLGNDDDDRQSTDDEGSIEGRKTTPDVFVVVDLGGGDGCATATGARIMVGCGVCVLNFEV